MTRDEPFASREERSSLLRSEDRSETVESELSGGSDPPQPAPASDGSAQNAKRGSTSACPYFQTIEESDSGTPSPNATPTLSERIELRASAAELQASDTCDDAFDRCSSCSREASPPSISARNHITATGSESDRKCAGSALLCNSADVTNLKGGTRLGKAKSFVAAANKRFLFANRSYPAIGKRRQVKRLSESDANQQQQVEEGEQVEAASDDVIAMRFHALDSDTQRSRQLMLDIKQQQARDLNDNTSLQNVATFSQQCELLNKSAIRFASRKQLCDDGEVPRNQRRFSQTRHSLSRSDSHIVSTPATLPRNTSDVTDVTSCHIALGEICNSIPSLESDSDISQIEHLSSAPGPSSTLPKYLKPATSNGSLKCYIQTQSGNSPLQGNQSLRYKHIERILNESDHTFV